MKRIKTVTLCASVSFYESLFAIEKQLIHMGYKVLLPKTARIMKIKGDFNVKSHKSWYTNPDEYYRKRKLMDDHFKKVLIGDAIMVVNLEKNGIPGYIGGNTLMEMAIAHYFKKQIYLLNQVSKKLLFYEEVQGLYPIVLNGDLSQMLIKRKKQRIRGKVI